jgi:hypothetical protein
VVARRKALDLLRRESARAAKETAVFRWGTGAAPAVTLAPSEVEQRLLQGRLRTVRSELG